MVLVSVQWADYDPSHECRVRDHCQQTLLPTSLNPALKIPENEWYYTCCIKSTDKMSAMVVIMLSIKIQTRLIETGLHLVSSPVSSWTFQSVSILMIT